MSKFETIRGQRAASQLALDIERNTLAPSMLFSGPACSGKGVTALELARILSCERGATDTNCTCPSCARHKFLSSPDLLVLGAKPFSAEIAAAAAAFRRDTAKAPLFIRALKKLLLRFAAVLWEDEPKFGKLSDMVVDLEADSKEIMGLANQDAKKIEKRTAAILKDAVKLESEGITDAIAIGQIRKAAAWTHFAPNGRQKFLLIENADRMQEGARNSLLKLLEEPPTAVHIALTTEHEQALLPTILSRLRPYRFNKRQSETEASIIAEVFGDNSMGKNIRAYLDSFLPVSGESLRPLAAFFAASVAINTAARLNRPGISQPVELVALGRYTMSIAENAGLGRPALNRRVVIGKILAGAENFEIRGLFQRFLRELLTIAGESWRTSGGSPVYLDIWRQTVSTAGSAVGSYNQKPSAALDRLGAELSRCMTEQAGL
ncbi:MAG: DNA polymerase III [Treponema sp.]|jgi:DNA polymerase-3 subunit gamma/tau|nr:DNA polymerase III [Treponema sp.]